MALCKAQSTYKQGAYRQENLLKLRCSEIEFYGNCDHINLPADRPSNISDHEMDALMEDLRAILLLLYCNFLAP